MHALQQVEKTQDDIVHHADNCVALSGALVAESDEEFENDGDCDQGVDQVMGVAGEDIRGFAEILDDPSDDNVEESICQKILVTGSRRGQPCGRARPCRYHNRIYQF